VPCSARNLALTSACLLYRAASLCVQRWWAEQDGPTQAAFKELVANGQLTFINGGWCMHDEAAPGYIDMIDRECASTQCLPARCTLMQTSLRVVRLQVQSLAQLDIPSDAAETTLGKRYIKEEFGAAANPQTTWQIDPFGHSATQSSLMTAASGYQGALQRLAGAPGGW